jgi:hypothetical protein
LLAEQGFNMKMESNDPIAVAREALNLAKQNMVAEIRNYPGPISGCDAQFNHLLAARLRISRALAALDADVVIPTPRTPH